MLDADVTDSVIGEGCVIKVSYLEDKFILSLVFWLEMISDTHLLIRQLMRVNPLGILVDCRTVKFTIPLLVCDLAFQRVQS